MLAAKAPEKERLLIEATYADYVERDPMKECALLEELTRKYPDEKRFHTYLGFSYVGMGRSEAAVHELNRTLELDPEFAPAVNQLGYLYAEKGKFNLAITTLERYAALAPGDANPYDSMGEIYLQMGKLDRASECYREALRIQPSFFGAYKGLAYVYALMGQYGKSLQWIDSLCAVSPSPAIRADALGWTSILCSLAGRERESHQALLLMGKQVEALGGFGAPLFWLRAWAALRDGQRDSSRVNIERFSASYARAHAETPATGRALFGVTLGLHEVAFGELDSAQAHLAIVQEQEGSLESYRSSIVLLAGMLKAEVLLARGMPDSAIAVYRRTPVPRVVMRVGWRLPLYNVPRMRDVVPRAFLAMGKLDSAIAAYQDLIRIDSASSDRRLVDPIFHYRLAQVYERAGKQDLARDQYRLFLSIWKNADLDRPELIDAKKRVAILGQVT